MLILLNKHCDCEVYQAEEKSAEEVWSYRVEKDILILVRISLSLCSGLAHCSRRGPRLDLSYQQKFQQIMKIR